VTKLKPSVGCSRRGSATPPSAAADDDHEIGHQGADLIDGCCSGRIDHLGWQDISVPRIRYWLNRRVMQEQGISLPGKVMADAERVFE
jgi:hypothetical protein